MNRFLMGITLLGFATTRADVTQAGLNLQGTAGRASTNLVRPLDKINSPSTYNYTMDH